MNLLSTFAEQNYKLNENNTLISCKTIVIYEFCNFRYLMLLNFVIIVLRQVLSLVTFNQCVKFSILGCNLPFSLTQLYYSLNVLQWFVHEPGNQASFCIIYNQQPQDNLNILIFYVMKVSFCFSCTVNRVIAVGLTCRIASDVSEGGGDGWSSHP